MEAFAAYLLKSVIWLTGFALVYFLFLRNERFFRIKRYYLIAGIVISFIFPLFTIHYSVNLPSPVTNNAVFETAGTVPALSAQQAAPGKAFDYRYVLLFIYLAGIVFLTFRMLKHVVVLLSTIRRAEKNSIDRVKVIRTSEIKDSFSFFSYVFVNPSLNETETEMIMNHELVHVNQKHWFDLLLVEFIRLLQWMNPVAWIYSDFIRQNHEYIADKGALQRIADPAVYKAVLVNQLFDSPVLVLSNSFNYSINKKRFDMMKKKVSSPYRKMKILLVLPVFAIVFYAFATPEYHYLPDSGTLMSNSGLQGSPQKKAGGIVVNEDGKPLSGVTIVASNSLTSVITNAGGKFVIGIPDGSSLIFSFKGYKSYTLPPLTASNQNLYVKMVKDPDYKKELKIMASDGSEVKALVVVDGVISEDNIGKVDPDAILTMTVLKDEEATSKYGEKGKDGVIEITTKKKDTQTQAADQKTVKGIVLKEDGQPLTGVNVTATGAMGNASFVTTGPDGRFEIKYVQSDALLIFSGRGYKKLSLKPDFNSAMTVKMEIDPDYKEMPVAVAAQRPEPLVIIDGVISDRTFNEARRELGYNLGPVKLLAAKEATEKFGEKGVNGAWEITTRKKALEMGLKPPFPRLSPDDYPTFQGQRYFSFNDWVKGQVRYPEEARAKQVEGWVQLNFTVNLDGTISNVRSVGTADKILVDEVIRVITSSPKWEPPRNSEVDEPFTSNINLKFKLPDQIGGEEPFVIVEQMPQYPGGEVELLNFIRDNTKYPEAARANKIQGKVIIRFIVNTQGMAEGISILKGVDPELDFEAVRVVSLLSGFKPGMQGGKDVNVWYMVPVNFEMPE
ncbi:MAG: TonB family protein [Bacteroidales bacterium]